MRFFLIFIINISTAIAVPYLVDETPATDETLPVDEAISADGTVPEPFIELYSDQAVPQKNPDGLTDNIQIPAAGQVIALNDILNQAEHILPDEANPELADDIVAFDPVGKVLDQIGQANKADPFWSSPCRKTNSICCTEDMKPASSSQDFVPIQVQGCSKRQQRLFPCGTPKVFNTCDELNALVKQQKTMNRASEPLEITCYSDCP